MSQTITIPSQTISIPTTYEVNLGDAAQTCELMATAITDADRAHLCYQAQRLVNQLVGGAPMPTVADLQSRLTSLLG